MKMIELGITEHAQLKKVDVDQTVRKGRCIADKRGEDQCTGSRPCIGCIRKTGKEKWCSWILEVTTSSYTGKQQLYYCSDPAKYLLTEMC